MNLSCVAPITDRETLEYVEGVQRLLRGSYHTSFNADAWIPHITLGHEVEINPEELPTLRVELDSFLSGVENFILPATGFNIMKKESVKLPKLPWVINIGFEKTPEVERVCDGLRQILERRNVAWRFEGENGIDYLRLTLASRDLREEDAFRFAEYAKVNPCPLKSIQVDTISLIEFTSVKSENKVAYEKRLS